ncbi:DNA-binding transcriptional LysR family regulator [Lachnospiraceae bacterium PF1-21]|uniref:LysR family transcriptional regulator n=1 Tax=Ohessyouella blattaphilus TaxID=2949333 RepID=A0ABT1EPZ2_9FIRM|nr:LysR family transcriptional regulator [Ohessyouella blattaphilus]MCP1111347.1 LysR family transcriptional regulator [Ohessyouella blattaphilus]MCR8564741.1 LysR family transcriptional regulator [Ohessyouella blattaphilus]MDL2250717.1 LysR family transcriptional regulator [Lachnospiraceae bacterium OttesenSCG-928-J05]
MEITYDYYRIFYFVAKYQSFTQAAKVLGSNQPNLTKYINNLEHQLSCKLFIRTNRGVSLTPEGEKLYRHVAVAFEQFKAAEMELANDKNLESGVVTIGVSNTALHGMLLPVLGQFRKSYPGIHLKLSNQTTPQSLQALKSGTVDFSLVTTPLHIQKPFVATALKSFQEILIGSPQYQELAQQTMDITETVKYPLIFLGVNTTTREFYNTFYSQYGLVLTPDIETATTDQLLPLVKNNLGLAFIPEEFATTAIEDEEVITILLAQEVPARQICIVEDSSRHLNIAASKLKQMIVEAGAAKK